MVGEKSIVGHIDDFHPHEKEGGNPIPEFARNGLGTIVLNHIISDAKKNGPSFLYVQPDEKLGAEKFYGKKGFIYVPYTSKHMIKKI